MCGRPFLGHQHIRLRPNRRAGGFAPRPLFAGCGDPAEHVVRRLAAVFAGVVGHVRRARVHRQEAQLAGAGRGRVADSQARRLRYPAPDLGAHYASRALLLYRHGRQRPKSCKVGSCRPLRPCGPYSGPSGNHRRASGEECRSPGDESGTSGDESRNPRDGPRKSAEEPRSPAKERRTSVDDPLPSVGDPQRAAATVLTTRC